MAASAREALRRAALRAAVERSQPLDLSVLTASEDAGGDELPQEQITTLRRMAAEQGRFYI